MPPVLGLGIIFWTQCVIGPSTWFVMFLLLSILGINCEHRYATKVGPNHIFRCVVAVGDVSPLLNKSAVENYSEHACSTNNEMYAHTAVMFLLTFCKQLT